jgi:hypothetical protein
MGSNDRNLLDPRKGQAASEARSRRPFCFADCSPHRGDTQRRDRPFRSSARPDVPLANTQRASPTCATRGTPSPAQGTHCGSARRDAANDCQRDTARHGDCGSREGPRDLPVHCGRAWADAATGAADHRAQCRRAALFVVATQSGGRPQRGCPIAAYSSMQNRWSCVRRHDARQFLRAMSGGLAATAPRVNSCPASRAGGRIRAGKLGDHTPNRGCG